MRARAASPSDTTCSGDNTPAHGDLVDQPGDVSFVIDNVLAMNDSDSSARSGRIDAADLHGDTDLDLAISNTWQASQ